MCENSKYYTISHSVKYFLSSINTKCSNELLDMQISTAMYLKEKNGKDKMNRKINLFIYISL